MAHESRFDRFVTRYARSLIRTRTAQLARRPGFAGSDREDLSQHLWTALFEQAGKFDPTRASIDTFIDRVVNTAVGMLLRERRRRMRAAGLRAQSLDQPARGCSLPLAERLEDEDRCRRLGTVPEESVEAWIDAGAFAHAMASAPVHLRDVLRRVMGGSVVSAARELGVSRRQIRNALAQAREHFERAGFGELDLGGHSAPGRHK
ncbi:MAG: sigma-70 family RNA polymerase sigma factor [Planctomycetaceae bacterium]